MSVGQPDVSIEQPVRRGALRWAWFALGWVSVGLGSIGAFVPGLPTTVFFVVAASCFARSSPRFERWVLDLPRIGPLVSDYRAGLGMSRKAKAYAIGTMVVVATLSLVLTVRQPLVGAAIVAAVLVGAWYIAIRLPTRETVVARLAAARVAASEGDPEAPARDPDEER